MKSIIFLMIFVVLLAGCDRTLDTDGVGFEPPSDVPVPIALKIYHLSDGMELTWQISDTGVVSYFNVYYSTGADELFLLWDSTREFSLAITELNSGLYYNFRVAAVDTFNLEGAQSSTVSTQVGVTSVTINANHEFTNSRNASLQFAYPVTPILMRLSEDENMTDAVWVNFQQSGSFVLSDGDGVKWVYASLRFADGSESYEPVTDSIILDTRAYIDSVYFSGAETMVPGDTALFYLDAGEAGGVASISFTGLNHLSLFDDGSDADLTAGDGIYSRRYIVPINLEVDNGLLTGGFTDVAGNSADSKVATKRINIKVPPDPLKLQTVAESSSAIRLNWTAIPSEITDFTDYRIYRATSAGVDESSDFVVNIAARSTLTFTDTDLDDNQQYYYRVFAYGTDGLIVESEEASATTHVNTPPSAVTLGVSLTDSLVISISWTENEDDDFESYQIYRGNSADVTDLTGSRLAAISNQGQTSYTDTRLTSLETYYYVIYVYDKQGLKSAKSNVESTP